MCFINSIYAQRASAMAGQWNGSWCSIAFESLSEVVQQGIPGAVDGCTRVRDEKDVRSRIFSTGEDGMESAVFHVARYKGLREKADTDTEDGQPSRLLQVLRKPSDVTSKAVTHAKTGQLIGFVGAGKKDRFAGQILGAFERLSE